MNSQQLQDLAYATYAQNIKHAMRDTKITNSLPDPENHRFFTKENNEKEVRDHWLVRLFEWNVSRWLRKLG